MNLGYRTDFPVAHRDQRRPWHWSMVGRSHRGSHLFQRTLVNGILAYQLMSFAGNRDRGSVNQTYLEPEISYNFDDGWYVDIDPAITFDWTADATNGWSIPMDADVGKAFYLGSQSMSLQVGAYDFIERPDGTPQWIIRVHLTLLYPTSN